MITLDFDDSTYNIERRVDRIEIVAQRKAIRVCLAQQASGKIGVQHSLVVGRRLLVINNRQPLDVSVCVDANGNSHRSPVATGLTDRDIAYDSLLITLLFLVFTGTDFMQGLERSAYDFSVRSTQRIPSDKIAVIAIDDESIAHIGRWPWPT
mgnify:CR=1 FL=1